jgi:hypothetical protein
MDILLITLRVIHIFAGVFWTGAAIMLAGFVEPTVRALGPEGGKFMQRMAGVGRLSLFMFLSSLLATLAGIWLYWRTSLGFQPAWILSPTGLVLTIGSIAGILEAVLGNLISGRTAAQMVALGQKVESAGGPPTPEQMQQLGALSEQLRRAGVWGAILLSIAVIAMAIARYVG